MAEPYGRAVWQSHMAMPYGTETGTETRTETGTGTRTPMCLLDPMFFGAQSVSKIQENIQHVKFWKL